MTIFNFTKIKGLPTDGIIHKMLTGLLPLQLSNTEEHYFPTLTLKLVFLFKCKK